MAYEIPASSYTDVTVAVEAGTENIFATNELPVDMHSKMFTAYPTLTPLTVALTRLASDSSHNYRIDWIEKNEIPTKLMVATTESSASTTVTVVANADTLVKDTLLYNPRADDLRIVDDNTTSATSITVSISQGGKTSSVWNAGDEIWVLPPALVETDNAENSETYRDKSVADTDVYNLHQIVKKQFSITRVANLMKTHFGGPGSKRAELKAQKYREYRKQKEALVYFGGRATGGTAPDTRRLMGGLSHYLRDGTLFKDFNGILTESGWRSWIGDYKDQNPDATEIYFFGAGSILDLVTDFGLGKTRITPLSKKIGLDVTTYISRGITCNMVSLPLLDSGVTRGYGFLLDMERIKLKTLAPDTFYPDAKNVGETEMIYDTFRGVFSLMVANESRHAMCIGADL